MDDVGSFVIEVDGIKHVANVIMNFELYGDYFCIYGIKNKDDMFDIYCGQVFGQNVMPITDERNKTMTDKIVLALTKNVKGMR